MNKSKLSSVIGVLVGTILEWYDFSLFASMAPVMATLFFPSKTPALSLLAAFGVFASGFLMRPLGGIIFGHIGDRYGRKSALSLTIILMAVPTMLIGALPTFAAVGALAPVMLILLRLVQGAASSGEQPGAICFLTEIAPANQRGLWGSLSMFGVTGGILLGSLVNSLLVSQLSNEQLYAWGWRIPFIMGLPLGLIGWFIRYKVSESDIFKAAKQAAKVHQLPFGQIIKTNLFNLIKTISLFSLGTISFYLSFVYIGAYLVSINKLTFHQALVNNAISTFALILLLPLFGYLSDILNRKYIMIAGAVCLSVFFYPIFLLFLSDTQYGLLSGQLLVAVFIAMFSGPVSAATAEMFSTVTRYSGVATGLNIGASIFGGTCPLIATYLVNYSGKGFMPSIYPVAFGLICLIVIFFIKNNQHVSLDDVA